MKASPSMIICLFLTLGAFVFLGAGCARQQAAGPLESGVSDSTNDLPLPDWAPENPSPEFLRAWEVLRPMPVEMLEIDREVDKVKKAAMVRNVGTWPAYYEFFGTLSDEQIDRFLRTKEIRIPAKSLTANQQAAVDNFFEVWRREMKGTGDYEDFLTLLYKSGAKEDFSNVDVGFDTGEKSQAVHIRFWITQPDGSVTPLGSWFAVIWREGGE
ncbi:MAG: hypothetical protein GTN69_08675 [Armatimonadetes bacterium]|nr:hypothetical protein [Armatimonadota bacterium]NIO75938.1 hypothetical protein [Armatimonadota bacterium]NIO98750.1 hypothetical protein [Armatimonadota bacterium]